MEDGARCHSAANKRYMTSKGWKQVDWPPRSPDLNPIEDLWGILQTKVGKRGPLNSDELIKFVVEEWNALPMSMINNLVDSFDKRCRECKAAEGGTFKK